MTTQAWWYDMENADMKHRLGRPNDTQGEEHGKR